MGADATGSTDRGRRVYDRWAANDLLYALVDRATRGLRQAAVDTLALPAGGAALDLGCGPGRSIPMLAEAVGPTGRVLGVDYSDGMVTAAAPRAEAAGASVVQADAGSLPVASGSVDGAFASLALSAMPAARRVVAETRRVLADGGRFVVVDAAVPDGLVGRALRPLYARAVNFQNVDVLALLSDAFPTVEVVRRFDAGLGFVAVAEPD